MKLFLALELSSKEVCNVLILVFADNFILMLLASPGQWKVVEGNWKIDAVGN